MIIKSFRKILPFIAAISISLFFLSCCTDFGEEKTDDDNSRNAGKQYDGLDVYYAVMATVEAEKERTASCWKYAPSSSSSNSASNAIMTVIFFYKDSTYAIKQLWSDGFMTLVKGNYSGDTTQNGNVSLTDTYEYGEASLKLVEIQGSENDGNAHTYTAVVSDNAKKLTLGTDPNTFGFTRDY